MDVQVTWLRAYVEKCLRQAWEDRPVCVDEDGDFFFRCGTAACWVRVDEDASLIRVFAHAATGVKRSARLLAELNELNQRARAAKVYWENDCVVVTQTLPSTAVTAESMHQVCCSVGSIAVDVGVLAAAMFDGGTPFPADFETAEPG